MGFFDRLFRRQGPPEEARHAVTAQTEPVDVGIERIKRLFVCGKSDGPSPEYTAAEQRVVDRVIEARRDRLFVNQRVTTLTGPQLPDREVESFVRVLQMKHGTGLLAYRTEFCVEGGFSFLIIEMWSPSAAEGHRAEITVNAVAYPLADSIEGFCELGHRGSRAALRFAPHEYGMVLLDVARWFERQCGSESGAARAARSLELVCGKCCGAFSGMHFIALANASGQVGEEVPCQRCGSSQVLALYRFVDPKSITTKDLADIRAYLREQGRAWWASHPHAPAACDECNASVPCDEGWLIGSWLVCKACAARRFGGTALDNLKRNPDHFGAGVLHMARRAAGRSSAE